MKKNLLLLAALSLTAASTTFAQAPVKTTGSDANQNALHQTLTPKGPGQKTPAQKADHKAGKMAKELGLTADQEARVERLVLAREQETAALKAKYSADKKAGRPEMKAAHDRYEAQLKAILTPEQYIKFGQLKDEHHGHDKLPATGPAKGKAKS
ncbi:MAG: hypothetical protein NVS3B25_05850 [Hymenobacter sp.]